MPVAIPMPTTWDGAFAGRYIPSPNGCWVWTGDANRAGYGQFHTQRRRLLAHRLSLTLSGTYLRPEQLACHHCDNPPCIRPDHLYAGTKRTNTLDALRRGRLVPTSRARAYCGQGHEMAGSNLYVSPRGVRNCRPCEAHRASVRRRQHHDSRVVRFYAERYSVPRRLVTA